MFLNGLGLSTSHSMISTGWKIQSIWLGRQLFGLTFRGVKTILPVKRLGKHSGALITQIPQSYKRFRDSCNRYEGLKAAPTNIQ